MRNLLRAVGAMALVGCVAGDDIEELDELDVETVTSNACVISFGGHEICDNADNDCDGIKDETCGPIDPVTLPPGLCVASPRATAIAGDGGVVLMLASTGPSPSWAHRLDRVDPDGTVTLDVNWAVRESSTPGLARLFRAPNGRLYFADAQIYLPWVSIYEISPVTGEVIGTVLHSATPGNGVYGFAVDHKGGMYLDVYPTGIVKWNSTTYAFEPWVPIVGITSWSLMEFEKGDAAVFYTSLAGGENKLRRLAPGVPPKTLDTLTCSSVPGQAVKPRELSRDDAGRLYLATARYTTSPVACFELYRYSPTGADRVLVMKSDSSFGRVAVDPASNDLLVTTQDCGVGFTGFRRIPL